MFNEETESALLWFKKFRFRQAQQFIALVGLSLCYFTRTFSVLRHRTIWARERSGWGRIVMKHGLSTIGRKILECAQKPSKFSGQ